MKVQVQVISGAHQTASEEIREFHRLPHMGECIQIFEGQESGEADWYRVDLVIHGYYGPDCYGKVVVSLTDSDAVLAHLQTKGRRLELVES